MRQMRRSRRLWGLVATLVVVVVLAGCDDGAGAPEVSEEEAPGAQADADGDAEVAEAEQQDAEEGEVAAEVEEAPPRFDLPDAEPMELVTPGSGGGAWPVLAWEPVEGAASYEATLYAASGEAYWSWTGEATEVRVGAFPEEPTEDSTIGPQVHEPMTWDVVARDDEGAIIAQSGERPIAP